MKNDDDILKDIIEESKVDFEKNDEDAPTIITREDIDKFVEQLMNFEIKEHVCFGCGKSFFRNYDYMKCDECFFSQFPKEDVERFYRSFLE